MLSRCYRSETPSDRCRHSHLGFARPRCRIEFELSRQRAPKSVSIAPSTSNASSRHAPAFRKLSATRTGAYPVGKCESIGSPLRTNASVNTSNQWIFTVHTWQERSTLKRWSQEKRGTTKIIYGELAHLWLILIDLPACAMSMERRRPNEAPTLPYKAGS